MQTPPKESKNESAVVLIRISLVKPEIIAAPFVNSVKLAIIPPMVGICAKTSHNIPKKMMYAPIIKIDDTESTTIFDELSGDER